MKKIFAIALVLFVAAGSVSAAKKKAPAKDQNKPVFTTIKENPITTIKDQNHPLVLRVGNSEGNRQTLYTLRSLCSQQDLHGTCHPSGSLPR